MERLPFTFYALVQIAFLFVHYPTTGRFPRIASLICLIVLLLYCYTEYSLQSPGEDYVLGCTNGILMVTAVHMTFSCPEFPDGFQRTGPATKAESTPSELPFVQKLGWMAELAGNMRRIGLTRDGGAVGGATVDVSADGHGPTSSSARRRFVISRVTLSIVCLAVFHLSILHRPQSSPIGLALHEDARYGRLPHSNSLLLQRFWQVAVWTAGVVSEMTFLQTTAAALSVWLGIFEPEDWPPMFGSPSHAYSVRRFWSKTWHQVLRAPLEWSGVHFAQNVLNLERGTIAFMIAQIAAAFFVSAVVHLGGDYAIHRSFGKSGPTFQFFLLQPAAILIEEIAIRAARWVPLSTRGRGQAPRMMWRAVGYLWVVSWFVWCAPPWLDAISLAGGTTRTRLISLKMLERLA